MELCSSIEMFLAATAYMVVRTRLAMIQPILLAHEIQLAFLTDPVFLGVCPMTLGSFNRTKMSVAAPTPYVANRVDIVAL